MGVMHWLWKRYVTHRPKNEDGCINLSTMQVQHIDTRRVNLKLVFSCSFTACSEEWACFAQHDSWGRDMTLARGASSLSTLRPHCYWAFSHHGTFYGFHDSFTFSTAYKRSMKSFLSQLVGNGNVAAMLTLQGVLENLGRFLSHLWLLFKIL